MENRKLDIKTREDGFIEIDLKSEKIFDEYIYQQMQKDNGCLSCVRDPHHNSILYYDMKGYISLIEYLDSFAFEELEGISFLIYLFEHMIRVNTTKPIYMDLEYLFLSYDGGALRFLVVPASMDQWVLQKEDTLNLLKQITNKIKITQGYEVIGYLTYMRRLKDVTLPLILQGLHDLRATNKKPITIFDRIFRLNKDEEYFVKDLPQPKSYPHISPSAQHISRDMPSINKNQSQKSDLHHETVMLFHDKRTYVFVDQDSNVVIPIDKETFTIGRGKDNDLCIMDPHVSLHHAIVYSLTLDLIDNTSSNGTLVNNIKVDRTQLKLDDIVCIGRKRFILQLAT